MTIFDKTKNYLEFFVFFLYKLLLPKPQPNTGSLLFINSGQIGDLIVSSILLENPELFDSYYKVKFLIRDEYLELFKNYSGKVEFDGYNYHDYKFSLIYKYKFLLKLRNEGFDECVNLTAARGILNEEMTFLSGANKNITTNSFVKYLGNNLGNYFDRKYTTIIAKNILNEYEKHFELINYLSPNKKGTVFNNGLTFNERDIRNYEKFNYYSSAIVIAPFSSLRNRDWKKKYYCEIINKLKEKHKIVLIGSKNQKMDLEELCNADSEITVLAGELKLHEIPILLKNVKLFIGQDSGITHIALKMGTPLISIIGGGEFGRFFPYKESPKTKYLYSKMDCFLCHWQCIKSEMFCMTDIKPNALLDEVEKILLSENGN